MYAFVKLSKLGLLVRLDGNSLQSFGPAKRTNWLSDWSLEIGIENPVRELLRKLLHRLSGR